MRMGDRWIPQPSGSSGFRMAGNFRTARPNGGIRGLGRPSSSRIAGTGTSPGARRPWTSARWPPKKGGAGRGSIRWLGMIPYAGAISARWPGRAPRGYVSGAGRQSGFCERYSGFSRRRPQVLVQCGRCGSHPHGQFEIGCIVRAEAMLPGQGQDASQRPFGKFRHGHSMFSDDKPFPSAHAFLNGPACRMQGLGVSKTGWQESEQKNSGGYPLRRSGGDPPGPGGTRRSRCRPGSARSGPPPCRSRPRWRRGCAPCPRGSSSRSVGTWARLPLYANRPGKPRTAPDGSDRRPVEDAGTA